MENKHWPNTLIIIHWMTVVLITAAVALAFLRGYVESRSGRALILDAHRFAGISVLIIAFIRFIILISFRDRLPRHNLSFIERWASRLVQGGLYLAMVAVPLLGWSYSNAHGDIVTLFGLLPLPALVDEDIDLAETLGTWHVYAAYVFIGLSCLHAVAALWHHLFKRDEVLKAMTPGLQ